MRGSKPPATSGSARRRRSRTSSCIIQFLIGIFGALGTRAGDQETSRRIELQAFCWTYYSTSADHGFDVTRLDEWYISGDWSDASDPQGHGSAAAQQIWGPRGYAAPDLSACNPWAAAAQEVA